MNFCHCCGRYEFTLRIGELCCNVQEIADQEWEMFSSRSIRTTQLIFWANGSFGVDCD